MQQSDEFDLDALLQAQSSDDDDDDGLLLPDFERSLEDILNDVDSAEGEEEQEEEKDDDEDENNNHDAGHDVARVKEEEEKEVVVPVDPVGGDITARNYEDAVAIGVVSGSERRTIDSPLSPARSDHGGGVVEGFLLGGGALQVAEIHQGSRVWDRVANGGIPRGVSASASFSSVALGWGGSGSGGGGSIIRPSPRPGAALAWAAAASRQSTRSAASSSLRKTLSSASSSLSDGLNTTSTAAPITPVVEKDGDVDREQEEDAEKEKKNIGEDNLTVEKELQFSNSVIFQEELEGSTGRLDAAVGELSFHVVGALEWEGDAADMNSQAKGRPQGLSPSGSDSKLLTIPSFSDSLVLQEQQPRDAINSLQEEEEEEEEEQQQQQPVTSFIGFGEVVRDPINEDHSSLQQLESLIGTVDDSESLNSDNASDEASSSAAADEPVWMEEHHERASQSAKDSGYRDTDVEYRHPGLDPSNRESEAVVGLQELSGNGGTETTKSRWQEEEKQVQNLTALDLAEEQEKRTASSGLHWEEGVAARPMQLEGIQRGPPAIGLLQLDSAGSLSHALASPAMRRDHGSPEALAVHTNLIAVGLSKGALLVTPSKYSATCSTDEMEPSKVNADQFPPPTYVHILHMMFSQDILESNSFISLWLLTL